MGLFDKLERKLEQTVNGAFAKAFRSEVQPVEIASAMRRAMDDRASSIGKNQRPIVPNIFSVELSQNDYDRLTAYRSELSNELIASAMEHAETQRYTPGGPVAVSFSHREDLETGVFRIRPSTAKQVDHLDDEEEQGGYDGAAGPAAGAPAVPLPSWGRPQSPGHRGVDAAGSSVAAPYSTSGEGGAAAPYPTSGGGDVRAAPAPVRRPQKQQRPWLDIDGDRYPLLGAISIVGRDDDADIILDDPGISRNHSEIRVTYDGPHLVVSLRDLGSTNGTYVNGDLISGSTRLADGDRITVGRTTFTIHVGGRR